jgi:glycolate dehydrogenase FAD-binding subunit
VLADFGEATVMEGNEATNWWAAVREVRPLASVEALWRVNVAPSRSGSFAAALDQGDVDWFYDWAGALVWAGAPSTVDVRALAEANGGHAMLVRAPSGQHKSTPVGHPEAPIVALLTARLKQAFDPVGVLDPHRFS